MISVKIKETIQSSITNQLEIYFDQDLIYTSPEKNIITNSLSNLNLFNDLFTTDLSLLVNDQRDKKLKISVSPDQNL